MSEVRKIIQEQIKLRGPKGCDKNIKHEENSPTNKFRPSQNSAQYKKPERLIDENGVLKTNMELIEKKK